MVFDLLKCFVMFFLVICAMVVGPLAFQLHVQQLELKQARESAIILGWIETQSQDTRIGEYRPD